MFTPVSSLAGGLLIGISASLVLLAHGRIAGVSGVLAGALEHRRGDRAWRLLFLVGLVGGGVLLARIRPQAFIAPHAVSTATLVTAGLLVGFGTRLGSGCTSGHGVCGIGRLSPRSIVATLTFMATCAAPVYVVRHLMPGLS